MAVVNSAKFNFEEVVQRMLQDYGYEVMDEVFDALKEVSNEAVKKLKKESAAKFGNGRDGNKRRTGKYAKGWTKTLERKRLNVYATIHGNKPTYALAHLLENGHALRQGGRTEGIIHIAPVNDWAQDEAFDRIVQKLEGRL